MKVNGKRIRADIVAKDANGNYHVFEVKNGKGRLTRGQKGSGVYDKGAANTNVDLDGGGGSRALKRNLKSLQMGLMVYL